VFALQRLISGQKQLFDLYPMPYFPTSGNVQFPANRRALPQTHFYRVAWNADAV